MKTLFKQYLQKDYKETAYTQQFSIRPTKLLQKLDRIEAMYKREKEVPQFFWNILNNQRNLLIELKNKFDSEEISPLSF